MSKITELFSKFKKTTEELQSETTTVAPAGSIKSIKNWYEERYENIIVQRNILFSMLIILLCLAIISVGAITYIMNSKRFDPFVIQIDDTTGMAKIVNPVSSSVLEGNEELAKFFIKKYVIARETYNPVDFDTEAKRAIRLLSENSV